MDKPAAITKRAVKEFAGVKTDAALARWWADQTGSRITSQAVHKWGGDDDPIPEQRQWQFALLQSRLDASA